MAPLGHSFEFADILSEPPPQVEAFDQRAITDAILARHSPAHVVINNAREVIYASGRTGRFLELSQGGIRLNIVDLAKPELKDDRAGTAGKLDASGGPDPHA